LIHEINKGKDIIKEEKKEIFVIVIKD